MTEAEKPTIFLRRASGLVRAWSPLDAYFHQIFQLQPVFSIGFTLLIACWLFPAGDMLLACFIVLVFSLCACVPYTLLSASMPRTGGDYVWQSRLLTPGHAFTFTLPWTWWFGGCAWAPYIGWMLSWLVWGPFLLVAGGLTGNQALINAALWLQTVDGIVFSGAIVCITSFLLLVVGMKWFARIQTVCFVLGMLGFLTYLPLAFMYSNADFVSGFNYVTNTYLGVSGNVYQQIIDLASGAGFNPAPPYLMTETLFASAVIVFGGIHWVGWITYLFGEVRRSEVLRNQIGVMLGGCIGSALMMMVIFAGLMYGAVGREFYQASIYTYYTGTSPLPFPPMFAFLLGSLTKNPMLMLWILFSLNGWWIPWAATLTVMPSRCMFACSFDRLLPAWVAEVRTRFRVPIWSLLLILMTNLLFVFLFNYIPEFTKFFLNVIIWGMWVQFTTVISAILWPWRRKDLFEASIARRYKWPMVITGILYVGFCIVMLFLYIVPPYGEWYGTASIPSYLWLLGNIVAHYVLYRAYRYKRKKEGIDFELIYKAIPVE